jgi:hypothetical protein
MTWFKFSQKTKRRYRHQAKKGWTLLIISFVLVTLVVVHQLLFVVRHVSCQTTAKTPCPVSISRLLNSQKGKSLLFLNKNSLLSSIKNTSSGDNVSIKFGLPGKLQIELDPDQPLPVSVYLSYLKPTLILENPLIPQLDQFISTISAQNYSLFPDGNLTPGTDKAIISLLFAQKPNQSHLQQTFGLVTLVSQNLEISKGYILDKSLFLSSPTLPDLIIPLEVMDDDSSNLLQSISSLAKIKEGIKTIDLRFNHPIIR